MPATTINDRLRSWADDLDHKTLDQARKTADLPIVAGHVALMADAHLGYGCAVGSVVPTDGAIIPSAVGVDIGCGMAAVRTTLTADDLPDTLDPLRDTIAARVPAGVGQGHHRRVRRAAAWLSDNRSHTDLRKVGLASKAEAQLGSLGSGNHFVEVSLDEADQVWVVLHSGSRGVGKELAERHINTAKAVAAHAEHGITDPDLAWLVEGTDEFAAYAADLAWAQAYAWENREIMLDEILDAVFRFVGHGRQAERVSCHHNYAERENHDGRDLWITRKGAIRARTGDLGVIPGSMGTDTFIVEGLGSAVSWASSSHGAGRRMSRNQAKKRLTVESLHEAMTGRSWLADKAGQLVDEHPDAYKNIEDVMAAQSDLVRVRDRLTAILNYKGTK